jgi:PAS domain S-box-containing protein
MNNELSDTLNSLGKGVKQLMLGIVAENKDQVELLLEVLENSTDGYWDWHIGSGKDGEEDYEYLSPKLKSQLGYEDEELLNAPSSWQKICNLDDMKIMFKKVEEHFASLGKKEFMTQCRYTHKKGHEVTILCRGNVIEWNNDGSPKRMVGTHTDITNLK